MSQLLYQLIHQEKTKRWLMILDRLEENSAVTATDLATMLGCTSRTIRTDIKQIKHYFDTSILLLGGEDGYHFSLQHPMSYTKKKQELIDEEPLFFYVDQLLAGIRKSNHEWAQSFHLSPASFGRIKRQFVQLVEKQYHVKIVGKDNQLQGEEAAIRQLMYDLYFTLPVYPNVFAKRVQSWTFSHQLKETDSWLIDPIRLTQWKKIAQFRINQRQYLPPPKGEEAVQERLAAALDEVSTCTFPLQEKAALFLLCLDEEQFLHPIRQKEFLRHFSSVGVPPVPILVFEEITVHFFKLLIGLMNQFFQLNVKSMTGDQGEKKTQEKQFFIHLMARYTEMKQRLERSLVLTFQLKGSAALQEWIKKSVRDQLQGKGYHLIEDFSSVPSTRRVTVTNKRMFQPQPHLVCLSYVPEEREIEQALQGIELAALNVRQ